MPGNKRTGKKKEKIKRYYTGGRHEANMLRKKRRHIDRLNYFKSRSEKFAIIIPQAIAQYVSPSIKSWFSSNVNKENRAKLINDLADRLIYETSVPLPKGRVKQQLRLIFI